MATVIGAIGSRSILGECPIWDYRTRHLTWVDIDGRHIYRWSWDADNLEVRAMDGRPGCIALTTNPEILVVASEHRIGLLDWVGGHVEWKLNLPIDQPSVRLNDGRVSPQGDLWIGSMHVPATDRKSIGSIYRVDPDWSWEVRVTGVGVANAMTTAGDGMLWADTLLGCCWVLDPTGPADPVMSGDQAPLIDFAALGLPGGPDGACTDASGDLWVACVHGGALAHLTAEGALIERIDVPVRRPTCPAFGGPNLDTLFVTSIGGGDNYPTFDDEPDAGRVMLIDVGVHGVPENLFDAH